MRRSKEQEVRLDPVAAYDRIAPEYSRIADRRRAYLDRIDQLIISEIPPGSFSLLDVGAGDGARAVHIAQARRIMEITLLEPSAGMRCNWPAGIRGWTIRVEELHRQQAQFDVITCLWNVLGHISPAGSRAEVLRQFARLLTPAGCVFIDVNHRYNMRHYGAMPTIFRMIGDRLLPREKNGDVTARWNVGRIRYATTGHVFTHAEFQRLSQTAGLAVKKSFAVDYDTGQVCRSRLSGNLLYVLQQTLD